MADNDPQLGAWNDELAALQTLAVSGQGSDANAPDTVRFGRFVMQVVARRERSPDAEFDRPAAFVLLSSEQFDQFVPITNRERLLKTGHYTLTGKVHLIGSHGSGRYMDYEGDADELFTALERIGAQSLPTLVYSPKKGASVLSWFPAGVAEESNVETWDVAEDQPTVDSITAVISRVHDQQLITPDQTPDHAALWVKPAEGWAQKDAESRLQYTVLIALLSAFRQCSVRPEQPGKDGRTDLEIVSDLQSSSGHVVHHAVLELKVLREKGSTGRKYPPKKNARHLRDGMEQAHDYGERRGFQNRMLCCFDMQATNAGAEAVMAEIAPDAVKLGVHLRHWFLYRSSNHWRKCSVARALKAAKTQPSPH